MNRRIAFRALVCSVACALAVPSARAEEKVRTRVTVASQPSGATVVIDGVEKGTTPQTLFDLTPGRHHLKYRLPGYEDHDDFLDTAEGPYVEKTATLEETKGILLLKTEPEGCDIQIDGVSVGQTPRLITHLPVSGTYNVKFRKAGYQNQSIVVRFDGRRPLVREEKLVQASGAIELVSDPPGAEVTVNGIVRGATPFKVAEVPKGRAVVKFRLDGFEEEVRELSVNAGDEQTLSVVLKGLPGTLHLSSVPNGARLYVNGQARGTAPLVLTGLKPGDYEVRAEMEGYATVTKSLTIENGTSANEEFRLSNVMGRLEVRTSPIGVQVFLDGRSVGVTQSKNPEAEFSDILAVENVREGEHTLVLKKDGYADVTRHPKIKNSQTAKLHRQRLTRIFVPDIEIVTARGSYRGVLTANKPDSVEIEVSLGIKRSFQRSEIRKVNFLKAEK